MANEKDITVHIQGHPPMHFPLGTSQEVIQAAVKKQVGTQGTGSRLWEALNKPVGEGFSISGKESRLPPGGIPEKNRLALISMLSKLNISDENRRRLFYALDIPTELLTSIPETGRRMTTPLGVATMGAGSLMQRLRDLTNVPRAVKTAAGVTEAGTGGAFGAAGAEQALTKRKPNESIEDYIERVMSGAGQALFGTSALAHLGGPSAEQAARSTIRGVSDRSAGAVASAERAAGKETAAKTQEYEKEVRQRQYEQERENRQAQTEFTSQAEAAKAKAKGEYESEEAKATAERAARQKQYETDVEAQRRRQQLETAREDTSKQLASNLDQAEGAERKQLDERYKDLDAKILGVTPENPNGTLQSELSSVGDAIIDARKNILKGSKTSIPIFNDILGRLKDVIETPEGDMRPIEGQMIPTSQLRGYVRELGDAIYDRENVPGDVRQAIKSVEAAAKAQVGKSIEDVHGKAGKQLYDQLSEDWSNYKRVWFDTSPNHPLSRIRRIFRDPSVEKSGLDVYEQIGKIIKGEKGRNVAKLLGEKTRYGADPRLAGRLMALDEQLGKYPKKAGEVAPPEPVEGPKYAKIRLPKPPEPKEATLPKPPKIEPFNRQEFIKEGVEKRMRQAGNWGSLLGIASSIMDLVTGNPGAAARMGGKVAAIQLIKEWLTSPGVLNWVSREGSSDVWRGFGAPRGGAGGGTPTPPAAEAPTAPEFKGGISAKGTEEAMRPSSRADLAQALHMEQLDLMQRAKGMQQGPQLDQLLQRMVQNQAMIQEFEGKPQ